MMIRNMNNNIRLKYSFTILTREGMYRSEHKPYSLKNKKNNFVESSD